MRIGMAAYLNGNQVEYGGKTIAMTTQPFAATPDLAATAQISVVGTRGTDVHIAARARIDFILATQVEI
jgi:hypothetical protein